MRGTMLWFNEAKDLGALLTDDGERIDVLGTAFSQARSLSGGVPEKGSSSSGSTETSSRSRSSPT